MILLISVVVIFFNQKSLVQRALASVIEQTHRELDIVVVDDGSDESIQLLVEAFSDERVRFFRKENGGAASARNLGLREAKSDYVAFLDGDDLFLQDHIERLVKCLSAKSWPICMVTSGRYVITQKGWVVDRRMPDMDANGVIFPFSEMYTSCSIYHRKIIERFGGFPEKLQINEDGALNVLIDQEYSIYGVAEVLTFYQMDDAGKARCSLKDYKRAIEVMEKRLAVTGQVCNAELMGDYKKISERNLLLGFLSCGNMAAARRWSREAGVNLSSGSFIDLLARCSIKTNVNIYSFIRYSIQVIKALRYLPISVRYGQSLRNHL
jgi:glycosyltransferase involved in cell wall biosynthesis